MPIYEYRCQDCEQIFEEWQKDFKERDVPCPVCGAKAERLISHTSFILKGSGWYVTDYCKRSDSGGASSSSASAGGNGTKPAESSPASEAAASPEPKAATSAAPAAAPASAGD